MTIQAQPKERRRKAFQFQPHPLKQALREAQVTQLDLEARLGVNQSTISIYLSGRRAMPAEVEAGIREIIGEVLEDREKLGPG